MLNFEKMDVIRFLVKISVLKYMFLHDFTVSVYIQFTYTLPVTQILVHNFFFIGTILAGDGYVAKCTAPSAAELLVCKLEIGAFQNRKGGTAVIVQAFCGNSILL